MEAADSAPMVELVPGVTGANTDLVIAQAVFMTLASIVGAVIWGQQAYTGISLRFGK